MEKKKDKTNNKKILWIILPIILIILIVGGIFLKQYLDLKKPIKEDWGQTYYVYLKDKTNKEIELPDNMKNAKINFYNLDELKEPVMAINYEEADKNYTNVYYINNEKINIVNYQQESEIEFLYNIENKEYDYYIHTKQDDSDAYKALGEQIAALTNENNEENNKTVEDSTEYLFKDDDKTTATNSEGNDIEISKFDETFVEVETEDNSVDYDLQLKEKELKETIEDAVNKYETKDEIITEDVKSHVDEQVKEVEKKQEDIKKIEEEKAKKEALEKELALGYKIGNYRLKYGTYKNLSMDNIDITITLSPDGKCHYKGNDPESGNKNLDTDCTYSQTQEEYYGVMTTFLTMKFNSGGSTIWQMSKNNAFNSQWLSFEYVK